MMRWVRGLAIVCAIAATTGGTTSAASAAWCKGGLSTATARARIGKMVRVKARVARTYFAQRSSGAPTFIDLDYAYPDSRRLTLVIWREDRANFPSPPERMFRRGKPICAQGVVTRYAGSAQIEVSLWDATGRLLSF